MGRNLAWKSNKNAKNTGAIKTIPKKEQEENKECLDRNYKFKLKNKKSCITKPRRHFEVLRGKNTQKNNKSVFAFELNDLFLARHKMAGPEVEPAYFAGREEALRKWWAFTCAVLLNNSLLQSLHLIHRPPSDICLNTQQFVDFRAIFLCVLTFLYREIY